MNDLSANLRLPGSFLGALGGRVASPRELDEQLQAGKIPQDSFIAAHQDHIDRGRQIYSMSTNSGMIVDAAVGGALASVVAGAVSAAHPLGFGLVVAAGAALGALVGRRGGVREDSGRVELDIDGHKITKKFYGQHPSMFEKTPQELRTYLIATQRLGEALPLPDKVPTGSVSAKTEKKWLPQAPALVQLGQQRRLVADVGQRTNYERPALNLVDAPQALRLMDKGKAVYAVEVTAQQDTPHNFTLRGATNAGTYSRLEDYHWTEREVRYNLVRLQEPDDLGQVHRSPGLPAGLVGVVAATDHCSERIYQDDTVEGGKHTRAEQTEFRQHETTWHS